MEKGFSDWSGRYCKTSKQTLRVHSSVTTCDHKPINESNDYVAWPKAI